MGASMIRCESDRLEQSRLGAREAGGPVFRKEIFRELEINNRCLDKRLDVLGIERQGALEKHPRLRQVFEGRALVAAGPSLTDKIERVGIWRRSGTAGFC